MKKIIGISAFYHDSAAALIYDDKIISAVQEERFSRKKNDERFPINSIKYLKNIFNCKLEELDAIVFYEKPLLKFNRLLETYVEFSPKGFEQFRKALPLWIKEKFFLKKLLIDNLKLIDSSYEGKNLKFSEHHYSHASSAFFPSPFKDALIFCADGVGEWCTTSVFIGNDKKIKQLKSLNFPSSIGLLYSAFTYFLGFKVNDGEYKMMGLAPYGKPKYVDLIYKNLIDLKEDGSFRLNMDYFDYATGLKMTNAKFEKLFDQKVRGQNEKIQNKHMDIAASIQKVTEAVVLKILTSLKKEYGQNNLCLAGGVALNCVANGIILKEKIFENIWIQPAAGDAGGSLGAALGYFHKEYDNPRIINDKDSMNSSLLGQEYTNEETKNILEKIGAKYKYYDIPELNDRVVNYISEGKIVGWFQGKTEFGPRALGNRSIIADPRGINTQKTINLKIKFRESFRPFAPIILEEKVEEFFGIKLQSKYMLIVLKLLDKYRKNVEELGSKEGLEKLNVIRSDFQSIIHVDYSARIQTMNKFTNEKFNELLNNFYNKTGCPMLINTSFNINNEPIVNSIEDAYKCFMVTDIDILVCNNYLLIKENQINQ